MKKIFLIGFLCLLFFGGMQAFAHSAQAACYRVSLDTCQRIAKGDGGPNPYCQSNNITSYSQSCSIDLPLNCPGIPPCGPPKVAVTDCTAVAQTACGTPPPTVTISVNPGTITLGQSANLTWTTTDATTCTASGAWSGGEPTSSSGFAVTPGGTGSYAYTLTCTGPGGQANNDATLQVNPVSSNGTINVTSENSQKSSVLVTSTWNFVGSIADPCSGDPNNCTGSTKTYINQVAGNPSDIYILNAQGSYPTGYALRSIEKHIAVTPKQNPIVAFFEDLINRAQAFVVCGFLNANTSSCPNPTNSFTLTGANDVANYIILWDPIPVMNVSPTTVSLTDATSQTITVSNTGTDGSKFTWDSAITYGAGPSGWLSVSPINNNTGVAVGSPQSVTLQNTGSLPAGSYSATVKLTGVFQPGSQAPAGSPVIVTVNLTVGGSTSVKVTPPTATVATGTTQQFTAVVTKDGPGNPGVTWYVIDNGIDVKGGDATVGRISGSGNYTAPNTIPTPPIVTIKAISKYDPTKFDTAVVTIAAAPYCDYFTADPQRVVIPQTSTLAWNCHNVSTCSINQGVGSVPVSGTTPVSPVTNTRYTLTCDNGTLSTQTFVDVAAGTPGRIETSTPQ